MQKVNDLKLTCALLGFSLISFSVLFYDNDFVETHQHIFFIMQSLIFCVLVLPCITKLNQLFLPSLFMLIYYLFSFSLGAYYVPRGYGFLTEYYASSFSDIQNYPLVVFFLLISNTALLFLSVLFIPKTAGDFAGSELSDSREGRSLELLFLICLLLAISFFEVFLKFGFQVMLIILIATRVKKNVRKMRYLCYLFVMITVVVFNHENKREVIMIAMILFFLESLFHNVKFNINLKSVLFYPFFIAVFVLLILITSILRGYGGFDGVNFINAFYYLPDYIKSDSFIDSLIDNFEISHTYPAAVLPVEYVLTGKMQLLYGESIVKPLFLPISRDVISFKPESALAIFTKMQNEGFYNRGGSLPVPFPAELFMNFYFSSILFLFLIVGLFDVLFLKLKKFNVNSIRFKSSVASVMLVFIFVRGGGGDLYTLTLLSAISVAVISCLRFRKSA